MKSILLFVGLVISAFLFIGGVVYAQTDTSTPTTTQAQTSVTPTQMPAGAPKTGYGTLSETR